MGNGDSTAWFALDSKKMLPSPLAGQGLLPTLAFALCCLSLGQFLGGERGIGGATKHLPTH